MRVILLTEAIRSEATRSFSRSFEKRGHTVTLVQPSELSLFVSSHESGFDRTYQFKNGVIGRIASKSFDVVYPRIGNNLRFGTAILDHLHHSLGIYCPIPSRGLLIASDKFQTIQICSQNGIRTPKTILYSKADPIEQLVGKVGGPPVVVKQLTGSQGVGVSVIDTMRGVRSTLESLQKAGITIILQEYIEANGRDVRAFVVGNEVIAAYQRIAPKGDFRANISGGGTGANVKLTKEEEIMCLRAAWAIGLPISAVDFIRAKSGEPYFIEQNGNGGLYIERQTGISVTSAIVRFVEQDFALHRNDHEKDQQQRRGTQQLLSEIALQTKQVGRILDPLRRDEYLNSLLKEHRGETLDYTDRNGVRQHQKLNSLKDLVTIMSQMFKIQ